MTKKDEQDFIAAPSPTEDVVEKPPRARVSDAPIPEETANEKLERKRDYLEGFLQKKPENVSPGEPGGEVHQSVIDALKDIYDPEIPVNIYDLGLIYNVEVAEDADVVVTMTLTTPHCPVAETMPNEIEMRVANLPGVRDAEVVVTWDPPWDPSKMSDEARLELGML
ncbi:SUF system Fe-S cluster assembly protein [Aurantiacibacter poecillastricola]|uniref:SUF system Fe-S cluster assembly protein n=1 Tax=Aurantiacibacter poecillastricola TaxID=3064385 RepID=UPI00273D2297|nr:SUF system Fe-S cluster assembly protein [Aurantiacibacter sp. 219JJ12-13]MDP5260554.1 SUF system Fe-S cluster assembly protein [Aurantiacibacter sp. 219JJ12-13]